MSTSNGAYISGQELVTPFLGLQSCLADKPLNFQVVYAQNGTAVLQGFVRPFVFFVSGRCIPVALHQ